MSTATDMTDDLWDEMVDDRPAIEVYGTPEHEAWLLEKEREDDRWAGFPETPVLEPDERGCTCVVSRIYGGDCAHSYDPSEDDEPTPEGSHTVTEAPAVYAPDDTKPVYAGFTEAELSAAFDKVKSRVNWKYPVDRAIRESDEKVVGAAIIFFTGSVPTFIPGSRKGWVRVYADGYYVAIGA